MTSDPLYYIVFIGIICICLVEILCIKKIVPRRKHKIQRVAFCVACYDIVAQKTLHATCLLAVADQAFLIKNAMDTI